MSIKIEEKLLLEYFPSVEISNGSYSWGLSTKDEVLAWLSFYVTSGSDEFEWWKPTMHLSWTRESLYELWKLLINLSKFETKDDDYHEHLDEHLWIKSNCNLVVHHSNFIKRMSNRFDQE